MVSCFPQLEKQICEEDELCHIPVPHIEKWSPKVQIRWAQCQLDQLPKLEYTSQLQLPQLLYYVNGKCRLG